MLSSFPPALCISFFLIYTYARNCPVTDSVTVMTVSNQGQDNNMASHSFTQAMLASLILGVLLFISVFYCCVVNYMLGHL